MTGIYKITNTVNGKYYIGSAVNIDNRWSGHRTLLRKGEHHNPHLQSAWDTYGEDAFVFSILEEVVGVANLLEREQYWIDCLHAVDIGYNMCPTAGNSLGRVLSEETKSKIANKHTGKTISDETKAKMSKSRSGSNNPMHGRKHSDEVRRKMSDNRRGLTAGEANPFYGKQHSDETKQLISSKRQGKRTRKSLTDDQVGEKTAT